MSNYFIDRGWHDKDKLSLLLLSPTINGKQIRAELYVQNGKIGFDGDELDGAATALFELLRLRGQTMLDRISELEADNAALREQVARMQEPLGADFEDVWNANTDMLYELDTPVAEGELCTYPDCLCPIDKTTICARGLQEPPHA